MAKRTARTKQKSQKFTPARSVFTRSGDVDRLSRMMRRREALIAQLDELDDKFFRAMVALDGGPRSLAPRYRKAVRDRPQAGGQTRAAIMASLRDQRPQTAKMLGELTGCSTAAAGASEMAREGLIARRAYPSHDRRRPTYWYATTKEALRQFTPPTTGKSGRA